MPEDKDSNKSGGIVPPARKNDNQGQQGGQGYPGDRNSGGQGGMGQQGQGGMGQQGQGGRSDKGSEGGKKNKDE